MNKELKESSAVETSAQTEKDSKNRKRKFKSLEEDGNNMDTVDTKKSGNGRSIFSKKKKKKKSYAGFYKRKGQNESKPFLTLQLRRYFQSKNELEDRLKLREIQSLILYCVMKQTLSEAPSWCEIEHRKKIRKVVLILLRAVGEKDFLQHATCFPFITKELSSTVAPTIAAGTDFSFQHVHETLLSVPLSRSQQKKYIRKWIGNTKYNDHKNTPIDKSLYLLTNEQLMSNKYPSRCFDEKADSDGFLPCVTQEAPFTNCNIQPVFALDCEMCVTSKGYELTRISIIDESMNVIYDTLVKPHQPILDYKTEYSGITAESLKGVTVTLQDVQKQVQTLIPYNAILAGHSFESDLNALKMYHSRIIDTAIAYQHRRGRHLKPALKFLAQVYLNKSIQNGSDGHCSIEDARTCMELVKLKFQKGPNFGLLDSETEGLFNSMDRERKTCSMLDYPYLTDVCQTERHHVLPCTSDSEIVLKAHNQIRVSHFTWIHLYGAQQFYDGITTICVFLDLLGCLWLPLLQKASHKGQEMISYLVNGLQQILLIIDIELCIFLLEGLKKDVTNEEKKEEVLKELDSGVRAIYEDIPENCLMLVVMGCSDVRDVLRLQKDPRPMKEELRIAVQEAKKGLCFMKIT